MMSGSKSSRSMIREMEHRRTLLESASSTDSPPPPLTSSNSETEDVEAMMLQPPTTLSGGKRKKVLSKQLSMRETKRELKWEKRRRQMNQRSRSAKIDGVVEEKEKQGEEEGRKATVKGRARVRSLTDEDLDELRGSIDLGFGFHEENGGQDLCRTLPALNLYFAVNRQLSDPKLRQTPSPASTPTAFSSSSTLYGTPSPRSPNEQPLLEQQGNYIGGSPDTWKIFKPGDSPQHVKTRLRHWAQIVACSVRQCC